MTLSPTLWGNRLRARAGDRDAEPREGRWGSGDLQATPRGTGWFFSAALAWTHVCPSLPSATLHCSSLTVMGQEQNPGEEKRQRGEEREGTPSRQSHQSCVLPAQVHAAVTRACPDPSAFARLQRGSPTPDCCATTGVAEGCLSHSCFLRRKSCPAAAAPAVRVYRDCSANGGSTGGSGQEMQGTC